jgi:hypothetical protein
LILIGFRETCGSIAIMKKKESGFDKLARLIKSESDDIRKEMATKDDIASIYRVMATKDDIAEVRRDMATKWDVEDAKEEVLKTLHPIQRDVDKDALAIVDHGVRIVRIEQKLGLALKK